MSLEYTNEVAGKINISFSSDIFCLDIGCILDILSTVFPNNSILKENSSYGGYISIISPDILNTPFVKSYVSLIYLIDTSSKAVSEILIF